MSSRRLKAVLVTGRSLAQGRGKDAGKFTGLYGEAAARCEMDRSDMEALGVEEGGFVKVSSPYGSTILRVAASRYSHPGLIFVAYGPWVNMVVPPETGGTGIPRSKGVEVVVESTDEKPLDLRSLIRSALAR